MLMLNALNVSGSSTALVMVYVSSSRTCVVVGVCITAVTDLVFVLQQ
jgi:hypothetical protein